MSKNNLEFPPTRRVVTAYGDVMETNDMAKDPEFSTKLVHERFGANIDGREGNLINLWAEEQLDTLANLYDDVWSSIGLKLEIGDKTETIGEGETPLTIRSRRDRPILPSITDPYTYAEYLTQTNRSERLIGNMIIFNLTRDVVEGMYHRVDELEHANSFLEQYGCNDDNDDNDDAIIGELESKRDEELDRFRVILPVYYNCDLVNTVGYTALEQRIINIFDTQNNFKT